MRRRTISCLSAGFTLIEMVVSLGLFSVVMLISLTALLAVSQAQKEAIAAQNNFDNLRFSLEAMTREIKLGSSFDCNGTTPDLDSCPFNPGPGTSRLTFKNGEGTKVAYFIKSNQLIRRTGAPPCNVAPYCAVTAKAVSITRFSFYVSGAPKNDVEQPRITVVIEGGTAGFKPEQTFSFNLQTTISPRGLNP